MDRASKPQRQVSSVLGLSGLAISELSKSVPSLLLCQLTVPELTWKRPVNSQNSYRSTSTSIAPVTEALSKSPLNSQHTRPCLFVQGVFLCSLAGCTLPPQILPRSLAECTWRLLCSSFLGSILVQHAPIFII